MFQSGRNNEMVELTRSRAASEREGWGGSLYTIIEPQRSKTSFSANNNSLMDNLGFPFSLNKFNNG